MKINKLLSLIFVLFSVRMVVAQTTVLFAPDDKPTKKLISLINEAKSSLMGAIYMITDKTVATAFVNARRRGVDTKLIIDQMSMGQYGKADFLAEQDVDVFLFLPFKPKANAFFPSEAIMHNKFLIIDKKMVWTGSFNWTVSANRQNQENVILTDEAAVCAAYLTQFAKISEQRCKPYKSLTRNMIRKIKEKLASDDDKL